MKRIRDKEKQRISAHKHYNANREKMVKRAMEYKPIAIKRNKEYIKNYLSSHPCIDCSEDNIIVLEFDHVKGEKENDIATGVNRAWSIEKLQKEIEKCEVRCANCHRIVTYNRRNTMRGGEVDNLVALITQRTEVRILPSLQKQAALRDVA